MNARVLVTGGNGFVGSQVVARLGAHPEVQRVVSLDLRPGPAGDKVRAVEMDVRDPAMSDLVLEEEIDRVIHLAAVVSPTPGHTTAYLHSVDVGGASNVIKAAVAGGARHLTVVSSGAAYGYHRDNPEPISEDQPLRGNPEFAYADHKRIVEELLEETRRLRPELAQLVLRPGTILGPTVDNQITALFESRVVLGVRGSMVPFVFVWDSDMVDIVVEGSLSERVGIFNVAGSGTVPLRQIAAELQRRYVALPAWLLRSALAILKRLRLTRYGPEQIDFLRYRPVLANDRLLSEFGYTPTKTSLEAFRAWAKRRGN